MHAVQSHLGANIARPETGLWPFTWRTKKKANVIVWYSWKLHGHLSGAQQTVAFQWRVFFGAISV